MKETIVEPTEVEPVEESDPEDEPEDAPDLTGRCYCGAVRYKIRRKAEVVMSAYCHCESCRRAHAAPMYQVCYIPFEDFEITAGADKVKGCPIIKHPKQGERQFCIECGSKVRNTADFGYPNGPANWRAGFFADTLDNTKKGALPRKFRPTFHHCPEEHVLKKMPEDGLPRVACMRGPDA